MWTSKRSIILSRICIYGFSLILIFVLIGAPKLISEFIQFSRADIDAAYPFFLITVYVGALPVITLLYNLARLLGAIEKEQIFDLKNTSYLRRISWSCFLGAIIAAVSMQYYLPWLFVAIAAAFMGLIVRVVKNIIAQAILLKEESDYTI